MRKKPALKRAYVKKTNLSKQPLPLTSKEKQALLVIIGLFLLGLLVRWYRHGVL